MNRYQHDPDWINKQALKYTARLGGKLFLKAIKYSGFSIIQGLIIPLLVVFLVCVLFVTLYAFVFVMPQEIVKENIEEGKAKVVSLFSFTAEDPEKKWVKEYDKLLQGKYEELENSWSEGLSDFQKEQAEQYKLSWAILAAVDRIMGDPTINIEARGKILMPEPEKYYEILKPRFEWKTSTIKKVIEWKEKDCDPIYNDEGKKVGTDCDIEHKKRVETEEVKLLTLADTYEAQYTYEYETVTTVEGEATLNSKKITTTKEIVKSITETGPYYSRLLGILADNNMCNKDSLEFTLELAKVFDDDFKYNLEDRWVGVNSLSIDFTKSYYNGKLGNIIWPLERKYTSLSSDYGWRSDPFTKERRFHTGIDIPAPHGSPVYSFADGLVRFTGKTSVYGNCIIIEHGDGYYTMYAHLSKIKVKEDEEVKCGDVIGLVGSTGRSTGAHLHFETRKVVNGSIEYTDPKEFFSER